MAVVASFCAFLAFSPVAAFAEVSASAKEQVPGAIDYLLLLGAEILLKIGSAVTSVMIGLLDVTIKLLSYNGFTESPVVSAGWSITRDTVNMFFVVVLIVIALGTIFGYHKFQWQSQVPRLMFFALVINFSKTICGILIDVGQVIMLTFANALQAVAAGNFIQLFALNQQTFSACVDPSGLSCKLESFDLFAGAAAALLASLWVLVTVLILVAVFAWRIVMLWVLVAIAPITWFVGGAHGIVQSHAYEDWWKKFTCAISVGPILTFFLWLTLSVAGSGSLAASKGLDSFSQSEKVATSIPITLFEPVHLMTFVIAMAMLYAGFEAASSFCGGASGFVGGLISKGQGAGKAMAFAGAGLGAAAAAKGGRLGLKLGGKAGKAVGAELAPKLAKMPVVRAVTAKGREDIWRDAQKGAGSGVIGRGISKFAGAQADQLEAERKEKAKETIKGVEGLSSTSKSQMAKRLAAMGGLPKTEAGTKEAAALWAAIKADKDAMKELTEDEIITLQNRYGEAASALVKGNKEMTDKQSDWEMANLDLAGPDAIARLTGDNAGKLSSRAIAKLSNNADFNKKISTELSDKYDKDTGERLTIKDAMMKGMYGKDKAAMFVRDGENKGEFVPDVAKKYYAGLDEKGLKKSAVADLAANLTPEMLDMDSTLAPRIFQNAAAAAAMSPVARSVAVEKFTSDPSAMRDLVKADPLALGNFKANELSGAAGIAAGEALDTVRLNEMLTRYKKASEAERVAMKAAMDNAETALDAAASAGGGNAKVRAIAEKFGGQRVAFEERMADKASRASKAAAAGSAASREAQLSQLNVESGRMAAEAERMSREIEDLERQISTGNAGVGVVRVAERQERLKAARRENDERRAELDRRISDVRAAVDEDRRAKAAADAEARSRGESV